MAMTDPIADMLTRIRNANMTFKDQVAMPSSKQKESLAQILKKEGYVRDYRVEAESEHARTLTIDLKYTPERVRTISGLKRISKPGLRVYTKSDEVPRVLGGLGIVVLSTSKGLMTDREARRKHIGGEILCYVW